MDAQYQFRLFGIPALVDGTGADVPLRTKKQYALLLHLALEGQARPVHRDRLAELIWPDVPADRGRHSLSQAVTELRERLGTGLFSRGGTTLRLEAPVRTDLDAIAEGEIPALPLEPLVGVDAWAGAEFAHWADAARERIVRQVADALRALVREHRRAGLLSDAHDVAGALYTLDPFSEVAVHALAEKALVRGDSVYAIQLLRKHVARVSEELQCAAQPGVAQLLRRLETGQVESHAQPAAAPARLAEPEFVGRHRELATLEGQWEAARDGALRTCLVSGAGGIGKSALLRRFATSLVARGAPVFRVSCQEIGAGIPFSAAADLVDALARDPGMSAASPGLLAELTRIVPSLRIRYPGIPQPDPTAPEAIRIRLSEALFHVVQCIGDGAPLAVAVDDIQHIDPASRDLLFLLQRRLAGTPVLMLSAVRSPGTHVSDPGSVAGLAWHTTLALPPLSRAEAGDLVARLSAEAGAPPAAVTAKIAELGGGNPYYIELLVADWQNHSRSSVAQVALQSAPPESNWQPPRDLRVAFARQFERLSETARSILHILATARRQLATEHLTTLIGCPPQTIDRALLELSSVGLMQPAADGATFKNDLHRAYVYYSMDADVRQWYHSRLAAHLATADPMDRGLEIEIGTHHLEAGQSERATARILSGARAAITVGAYGEAETALRRLLQAQRPSDNVFMEALTLLAEALRGQGKYRDVLKLFDDHQHTLDQSRPVPLLLVLRAEALQRNHDRSDGEISEAATLALDVTRKDGDRELYLRALQIAAESVSETDSVTGVRAIECEASRVIPYLGAADLKARGLMTTGYCQFSVNDCKAAAASFRASADCFSGRGYDNERMRVLNGLGNALLPTGRLSDAVEALTESLQIAVQVADHAHCATVLGNLGAAYEWMAMFEDAAACYAAARHVASECDIPRKTVEVYLNSFDLFLMSGDHPKAESMLAIAAAAANASRSARLNARALLATADMRIATAEPEFAWPLVADAVRMSGGGGWMLDNSGRYDRLIEHYEYATGQSLAPTGSPGRTAVGEIEVRALREKFGIGHAKRGGALRMAESLGLYGVIGRLASVQIYAGPEPEVSRMAGIRYVQQAFPHRSAAVTNVTPARSVLVKVGMHLREQHQRSADG